MSGLLDLPAAHRFAEALNERLRLCDNGEGMVCATLDQSINFHVKICQELLNGVGQWARSVFTGQIAFDAEVEKLLKSEIQLLLERGKKVAANGRMVNGQCYELRGLSALHYHIADFDYLLENWVAPQLAVGPAPRVKLPAAAVQQIAERLERSSVPPDTVQTTVLDRAD